MVEILDSRYFIRKAGFPCREEILNGKLVDTCLRLISPIFRVLFGPHLSFRGGAAPISPGSKRFNLESAGLACVATMLRRIEHGFNVPIYLQRGFNEESLITSLNIDVAVPCRLLAEL